jgi:hypothetical protein
MSQGLKMNITENEAFQIVNKVLEQYKSCLYYIDERGFDLDESFDSAILGLKGLKMNITENEAFQISENILDNFKCALYDGDDANFDLDESFDNEISYLKQDRNGMKTTDG